MKKRIISLPIIALFLLTLPITVSAKAISNNLLDGAAPIITSISIDKQSQTLQAGDTIILSVKIDEESDISTCQIVFENVSGSTINCSSSFPHREDGIYTFSYTIDDTMSNGMWSLRSTFVGDKFNHYGSDCIEDKSVVYFFVNGNSSDETAPIITSISIDKLGQTLQVGDTFILTVEIDEESDISTCQIVFENVSGSTINCSSSFPHHEDGIYTFSYTIDDTMSNGVWTLRSTFVGDKFNHYGSDCIKDKSVVYFFVNGNSSDETAPIITSITIDKQGKILQAEDTFVLTVEIDEESDISTCQIVFENVSGSTINCSSSFPHREDGIYTFSYTIDDAMSYGRWALRSTFVGDYFNHYGDDSIEDKSIIYFFVFPLDNLSVLELPQNLEEIQSEAFRGIASQIIIIPEGCIAINNRAFSDCSDLLYVSIPASVTFIADDAFDGCGQAIIDRVAK